MKLRTALAAMTALLSVAFVAARPVEALQAAAPGGAVIVILPGATATSATVAKAMSNGVPIAIGVLNPTTGLFSPSGLDSEIARAIAAEGQNASSIAANGTAMSTEAALARKNESTNAAAAAAALQPSNALSELAAARVNLGLGTAATMGVGLGAGQVAPGTEVGRAQAAEALAIPQSSLGQPNGPASLDANGKALLGQLPVTKDATGVASGADACSISGGTDCSGAKVMATGGTAPLFLSAWFGERIDLKGLNAKGNAISLRDGTVAAGSTAFTSPSASFTADDVGKSITVIGAAPSAANLTTTIAAVSGAHAVTLATPASTAVSPSNSALTALVPVARGAGYAPGDTFPIAGGTAATQAVGTVVATTVGSASVNTAGSGGTAGACVLTGTSGTGTLFRVNATISGNAISALGSIIDGGFYTANPSSLSAEPVTSNCGLTGAKLADRHGRWGRISLDARPLLRSAVKPRGAGLHLGQRLWRDLHGLLDRAGLVHLRQRRQRSPRHCGVARQQPRRPRTPPGLHLRSSQASTSSRRRLGCSR